MTKLINLNNIARQKLTFTKPGKYIVYFKNLSGKFEFDLKAPHIDLEIYGLFVGEKQNKFTVETVQRHMAPRSVSNLLIKGVFFDESKFIYQGLIRLEKKAQKSHAYQKNQNLIMSEKCFVDSRPFLEILANDVFCTHGSTTGRLNREQLYYLETRMLERRTAEKLIIDGFIREIPDKIRNYGFEVN